MTAVAEPRRRPKVEVVCPSCGGKREVTSEMGWQIRTGRSSGNCAPCARPTRVVVTETHLRFWLLAYGARVPVGVTVGVWVAEHGLPPPLAALAADYDEECRLTVGRAA